eukprot:m.76061 g.76061  ORF g.76061 m.76061 type:complete len:1432 (+) comp13158_c0_seq2:20-4315(+)
MVLGVAAAALRLSARDPQNESSVNCLFAALQRTPVLAKWPNKAIRQLAPICTLLEVSANTTVFKSGDPALSWYLIIDGSVDVAGQVCGPGDCFGFCEDDTYDRTARSKENSALLVISLKKFHAIRQNMPPPTPSKQPITEASHQSVEDLDFLTEVPTPPRPCIPHHYLERGDVVFDASLGDYVSSPAKPGSLEEEDDDTPLAPPMAMPLDRVRMALETPPERRTPEHVAALVTEMRRLHAFAALPASVCRRLCELLSFREALQPGAVVATASEVSGAWWVVVGGSVGAAGRVLAEGRAFGHGCAPGDGEPVVAQSVPCHVVWVPGRLMDKALLEGEKNTQRIEVDGHVVLVTERRVVDQDVRTVIVKGTPSELLRCLVEHASSTYFRDGDYVLDFLTTYRTFMSAPALAAALHAACAVPAQREAVAHIVQQWLTHYAEDILENSSVESTVRAIESDLQLSPASAPAVAVIQQTREIFSTMRTVHVQCVSAHELGFALRGGKEYGRGIFVSAVHESSAAAAAGLRRGDEILEANGADFRDMLQRAAIVFLLQARMAVLTVRHNPAGLRELARAPLARLARRAAEAPPLSPNSPRRASNAGTLERRRLSRDAKPHSTPRLLGRNLKRILFGSKSAEDVTAEPLAGPGEFDGAVHEVLRVYRADQSSKFIPVFPDTTAREVVETACGLWGIADTESHVLCEVSVVHGGLTKQTTLREYMDDLAATLGPHSRYYLKHTTHIELLLPPETKAELVAAMQSGMLQIHVPSAAALMAERDHDLFASIAPLEYLAFLWKDSAKSTASLQAFTDRFNQVCDWVASEVCRQPLLRQRVRVVTQFIALARHCHDHRNFNSMFAIISGLGSPPVARLKQTWERVPSKASAAYEEMERLMDPSRNMACYRALLAAALDNPPLVPFFPLLMKDLAFMHEGNETIIDGLVNFDKLRLLSRELRLVERMGQQSYDACVRPAERAPIKAAWLTAEQARRTRRYLDSYQVVRDQQELMNMSYDCELSRAAMVQRERLARAEAKAAISSPILLREGSRSRELASASFSPLASPGPRTPERASMGSIHVGSLDRGSTTPEQQRRPRRSKPQLSPLPPSPATPALRPHRRAPSPPASRHASLPTVPELVEPPPRVVSPTSPRPPSNIPDFAMVTPDAPGTADTGENMPAFVLNTAPELPAEEPTSAPQTGDRELAERSRRQAAQEASVLQSWKKFALGFSNFSPPTAAAAPLPAPGPADSEGTEAETDTETEDRWGWNGHTWEHGHHSSTYDAWAGDTHSDSDADADQEAQADLDTSMGAADEPDQDDHAASHVLSLDDIAALIVPPPPRDVLSASPRDLLPPPDSLPAYLRARGMAEDHETLAAHLALPAAIPAAMTAAAEPWATAGTYAEDAVAYTLPAPPPPSAALGDTQLAAIVVPPPPDPSLDEMRF